MLYSIKNIEKLENLKELFSLQNQLEETRLQDKLGKQKIHEHIKKVFEPVTDTMKITSEKLTKTLTESSIKNNRASGNLKNKLSEIMNNRGILASHLMSPLSTITVPENTTQFNLLKDSSLKRVNGLLKHNTISISLYNNLLTFCDTGEDFDLQEDPLKMITNKNYNVDLASLADKKYNA